MSVAPTAIAERQTVIFNAQKIADKFNTVDRRLDDLRTAINHEVEDHVKAVNSKIREVAYIAVNIGNIEIVEGSANEVRDALQHGLEQLADYANISTSTSEDGEINVFVDGVQMVTENVMTNSIKLHTDGNGMHFMADATTGNIIDTKSGYVKGMIDARDSGIKSLQDKLNTLASHLITVVITIHAS